MTDCEKQDIRIEDILGEDNFDVSMSPMNRPVSFLPTKINSKTMRVVM